MSNKKKNSAAPAAAKNMDMGPPGKSKWPFEHPADQDLIFQENMAADRTDPIPIPAQTINTAFYMHHPVFAAVEGRISQ